MILVFWFVAGFLLCLLHHKYQHLKWGIIAHCFLTLLYILIASVQVAWCPKDFYSENYVLFSGE